MPFREIVIPHIDAIARETGETAFAVHYRQGQIAFLYDCVSTRDIRLDERVGDRASPWNHPAGKVILAHHDQTHVLAALAAARRTQRKGLPTVESFRQEMTRIRKQGYTSQLDAETCPVAVPVSNDSDPVSAALMAGGPALRVTTSETRSLAKLLIQHAREVSLSLGWIAKS